MAEEDRGPRTFREALPAFLTHGSPRVLLAALLGAVAARAALGGFTTWDLAPPVVILALWPLQEWLLHVFVLHAKPRRILGRELDGLVARKHRAHHREPWRADLVLIPFHSFVYSLPILVGLCFLLTPTTRLALTALSFYLVLAVHYEWIHFLVHSRVRPLGPHYRRVWRNHRLHHFKNEHHWFGVTMRGGDVLLGTDPDPDDVPASPTARTLGVEVA